ncbi:MAG: glycosyltransferase family 4 protein [Opitutaceae bacterium]|jgi:glycosyltransferase involved in cell wall biosynthesis
MRSINQMLFLRVPDSEDSPYRQHELKEATHPRHYSDFLAGQYSLDWLPRSPHSLKPGDLIANARTARRGHGGMLAVAPSSFIPFALGLGLVRRPYYLVFWGNASRSKLRRLIVRANLFLAQRVIVSDRDTRDELITKWKMPPAKIAWLPLPVDTDYYRPVAAPRGDNVLVPGDTKRDEALVLAMAEKGDWTIVRSVKNCAGLGLYAGHPAIGSGRILIKKWATFSEIRANTQHALAVLLPFEECPEPVGLTALLEGMACGRPVIISPGRAARDHVVHGQTGFVLSGDRSTWVTQIAEILGQRSRLDEVGARAREYVVARHSFEAAKAAWADTLKKGTDA